MKRQNQTELPLALAVGMVAILGWGWGALEGGDVPGATAPLVQATCLSRALFLEFAHVSFCVLLRRGTSFKDVLLPACLWGRGTSGGFWQRERRSSGWSPAPGGLGGRGRLAASVLFHGTIFQHLALLPLLPPLPVPTTRPRHPCPH